MKITALIFVPAALTMPVFAHEIVALLLGPQWSIAADILCWLMPALGSLGAVACFGQFLTSRGKVSELRRWGYADVLIRGGGAAVGSAWGATGAAIGFSFSTLLVGAPIQMMICARLMKVSIKDQLEAIMPGIAAGIAAVIAAVAGSRIAIRVFDASPFGEACLAIAAAGMAWGIALLLTMRRRRFGGELVRRAEA